MMTYLIFPPLAVTLRRRHFGWLGSIRIVLTAVLGSCSPRVDAYRALGKVRT